MSNQNSDLNIKRLSSQRNLYSKAKLKQNSQFLISLIGSIIILIPIFFPNQNKEFQMFLSALPFVFLFINLIWINPLIKKEREYAAKIQEEFDCEVLNIEWNSSKIREKVRADIITRESLNIKEISKEKLKDWYNSDIINANVPYRQLYAQRTNVNWDINIKETYLKFLSIVAIIVFIEVISVIAIKDYRPIDILFLALMPLSAFINIIWTQIVDLKTVIKNLESIDKQIEKCLENLKQGKNATDAEIRGIQDQIFDLRKSSLFVPDIIFWKTRNYQTNIDKEVTKQKIAEIPVQKNIENSNNEK